MSLSPFPNAGRPVVVITGGASGIGWAAARKFALEGWYVIIADIDAERAAERIANHPERMEYVAVDVTSDTSVENAFDDVYAKHTSVAALVNSAGIQKWSSIGDFDQSAWEAVLEVNLSGTLRCLRAVSNRMRVQGGGSIVNLSSISGERGSVGRVPYAVSKAGVVALTRSAAVELAASGVRVNAVAPGYVATPLLDEFVEAGRIDLNVVLARIPMGRLADSAEIADVLYFLCSGQSSYITGQVIVVDGGFLIDYGVPGHTNT